jgi:hypothetical protein
LYQRKGRFSRQRHGFIEKLPYFTPSAEAFDHGSAAFWWHNQTGARQRHIEFGFGIGFGQQALG